MKRYIAILCLGSLLPFVGHATNLRTCAVLTFEAKSGVSAGEAALLSDRFEIELLSLKKFELLPRQQMDTVLKSQGYLKPADASESAKRLGQLLGVDYAISGSIGKLGTTFTVNVYLLDVKSGTIEKSIRYDMPGVTIDEVLMHGMETTARMLLDLPVSKAAAPKPPAAKPVPVTPARKSTTLGTAPSPTGVVRAATSAGPANK
jgi:TolB-like protein